jgi:hypothetical protein
MIEECSRLGVSLILITDDDESDVAEVEHLIDQIDIICCLSLLI